MFSETLKQLRESKGMTQSELAKELGVTLRTIQYYEKGTHFPADTNILNNIATTFDVPLQALVSSTEFYKLLHSETEQSGKQSDRTELYRLLQEVTTLFAGGKLSSGDRELFLNAVTALVQESHD